MKVDEIIRAWKDEEARNNGRHDADLAIPHHPAGSMQELSPEQLSAAGIGITVSSWVCAAAVTVSVCDELTAWFNELQTTPDSNPWDNQSKGCCFIAGTPVQTPGGYQPIESLMVGDSVLGFDMEEGRVRPSRVEAVDIHHGSFTVLGMDTLGGPLEVTTGHRFHQGDAWQPVERLVGQHCLDSRERKQAVSISSMRNTPTVYNLRVEGTQSYFVGEAELLVRDH